MTLAELKKQAAGLPPDQRRLAVPLRGFNFWIRSVLLAFFTCFALLAFSAEDNWPHWRGLRDDGSIEGGKYPVKWDADKVLWKAPLPGKGCSTPIVWNQQIYLTAPVEGVDAVLAFD